MELRWVPSCNTTEVLISGGIQYCQVQESNDPPIGSKWPLSRTRRGLALPGPPKDLIEVSPTGPDGRCRARPPTPAQLGTLTRLRSVLTPSFSSRCCRTIAAHITYVPDVIPVDFRNRTVFRRRANPNRADAVIVEAVRPGTTRSIELGVAMVEAGRAVWIPNPDADRNLVQGFECCVAVTRRTPAAWALRFAEPTPGWPLLVPLPSW